MLLTWEAVLGIVALIGMVAAVNVWAVRAMIDGAMSRFKDDFFKELNGRYMYRRECQQVHKETDRRLAHLEQVAEEN